MSRRTHCKRGHEFTEENTYWVPSRPGTRFCRRCHYDHYNRRFHGDTDFRAKRIAYFAERFDSYDGMKYARWLLYQRRWKALRRMEKRENEVIRFV